MIDGERAITGGKPGAAQIGKLLGVKLDGKPELLRCGKDLIHLGDRKGDAFAEAINRIGELCPGDGRQCLVADEIDIAGMIVTIFGGKGVGAEIARHHIDWMAFSQSARDTEHLELGLDIETIARFDLDRRHALGKQAFESSRCGFEQIFFACRACGAHGREDAAARLGDVGIGDAVEALLEFLGAVAAIDEMGVAVDQARGEEAPAAVDGLGRRRFLPRPGPGDPAPFHQNRTIFDQAVRPIWCHGRQFQVREKHQSHLYKVVYTV